MGDGVIASFRPTEPSLLFGIYRCDALTTLIQNTLNPAAI